jgi:hypothetical protein
MARRQQSLQASYARTPAFASSFDRPWWDIPRLAKLRVKRGSKSVTDLMYIVVGIAILAAFGLYAAGLRRI